MIADHASLHARVVLIGDPSVGKTSILSRLVDHRFNQNEQSTVGANFQLYVREMADLRLEMQIWDTAGQEKFRALGPIYYRNSVAAVAVFSLDNSESFEHLKWWLEQFTNAAGTNVVIAIAANKADIEDAQQDTLQKAEQYAKEKEYLFMKTSAKTGQGVNELFGELADKIATGPWALKRKRISSRVEAAPKQAGGCAC